MSDSAAASASSVGAAGSLAGVRVLELSDELAEYCGLLLAGLGAEVIKVEPRGGSATRSIGPFLDEEPDRECSLYFWQYNRGKASVELDLEAPGGAHTLRALAQTADVVLDSTPADYLEGHGVALDALRQERPSLITARISPYGDSGPWRNYLGSDLVHLALGGPVMNCGYDPQPDGTYDLPPIAPQMWHAYHVTGEQMAMMIVAALVYRQSSGLGQHLWCAVHEAVAKSTEMDLMSWVMRAAPFRRQTCRHANEKVSPVPNIVHTKDGRWFINVVGERDIEKAVNFLERYGLAGDLRATLDSQAQNTTSGISRAIPGSGGPSELATRCLEALQRLFGKFTYENAPWREAQELGLLTSPLRRPFETVSDPHWAIRGTCAEVNHPELGRSFTYVVSKWISDVNPWQVGRRAPLLGEDNRFLAQVPTPGGAHTKPRLPMSAAAGRRSFALEGVRVFDFSWFLASAGGTRFLASLGAEVIKVEWKAHPDTRMGVMAPVGGRAARELANGPLPEVTDPDMGGQFNNKNPGKRGISLNVKDPRGLAIAKRLISMSDIVAEGFSPGVLDKWGLGYDNLRAIKPDIIYAQQSGMGSHGSYGRFRSVGPVAAAFAGTSEMSGLPEPFLPAGWGYSYLDWLGAYSFALAMLSALHHRNQTGQGQWIDASQCEAGIFASGTSILDWSANGQEWHRYGNRSPYKLAAPHGIFSCDGPDAWIAIACFNEEQWRALCRVAGQPEWQNDTRFRSLTDRLSHQDELERAVGEWTAGRERYDLMSRLQQSGVPAGVCQTAADRCDRDPQLEHLGWLTEVTGTKIGTWPIAEVPVKMSATPATVAGTIGRGAPYYGEDNEYVYGELLGMSKTEIADLAADDVI